MPTYRIPVNYNSSQKSGFLLIEVIFSVFLVSVVGFYLASWYTQLIDTNIESINRSQALLLAGSLIDKAKILKSNFSCESTDRFKINYEIKKYNNYFNLIEIKVSWKSYFGKTNSVKLVGGYVV